MDIALLSKQDTGKKLYYAIWDAYNKVFDWADSTWKALGSATRPWVGTHDAINAVTVGGAGSGAFRVAGDITTHLVVGSYIFIDGSTNNDGWYTVRSGSSFSGGNTTVNVNEAVAAVADGNLQILAVEMEGPGGSGKAIYRAFANCTTFHNKGNIADFHFEAYEAAGDPPAPATDSTLDNPAAFSCIYGRQLEKARDRRPTVAFDFEIATNGTDIECQAWLVFDGETLDLATIDAAATCDIQVKQHGAGANTYQVDDADHANFALGANEANHYEMTKTGLTFNDDQGYFAEVTFVENGNTWTQQFTVGVFGGSA